MTLRIICDFGAHLTNQSIKASLWLERICHSFLCLLARLPQGTPFLIPGVDPVWMETTLAISSKSSIATTSCMAWSIVYPKSCRGNGTDNCNCISWLGAARFFWGQNGPQSVRTQTEWCYLADQPFSLVPWYFFCRLCLNRFEMIQSKQLSSSFKLIIYFTFSSLMFKI